MLSPMQVQYLVGLCCLRRNPEAVEITVGHSLYDPKADYPRDVDVTVIYPNDKGEYEAIAGYEVRRESRPLEVGDVEALVTKLNDIPNVSKKSIVSASGYSQPAVKKAKAHGIDLYEIVLWDEPIREGFPKSSMKGTASEAVLFSANYLAWIDQIDVGVNVSKLAKEDSKQLVEGNLVLLDESGNLHPKHQNFNALVQSALLHAATQLARSGDAMSIRMAPTRTPPNEWPDGPFGSPLTVKNVRVPISDQVYVQIRAELVQIEELQFSGSLQWFHERRQAEYYVMRRDDSTEVFAGAAVSELPGKEGVLLAILLSPDTDDVLTTTIHLTDKQKNMIRDLKLKRRG
jgi:hypothetical protein